MAHPWARFKRILSSPFRMKGGPEAVAIERGSETGAGRRGFIGEYIAELEGEIGILQAEMALGRDGQPDAFEISRRVVHARDLRYKAGLLRSELDRGFPRSRMRRGDGPNGQTSACPALRSQIMLDPGSDSSCLACLRALADPDPRARSTAATFLGCRRSLRSAPVLAILLGDENIEVRVAVAEALGMIGSEQTVFLLIRAMGDRARSVRAAARDALARILAVSVDLDIDRDEEDLAKEVEALVRWWIEARVECRPRSAGLPDFQQG